MVNYKTIKENFIVIIFFFILTLILTYPLVLNLNEGVISDSGNVWQFIWNFWWFKKSLIDLQTNPFFTDYLYYPIGTNLLFNLNMSLQSIISIPLQYFLNLFFIYNIFTISSFVLTAYGTYLLVKYLTKDKMASFVSGIIFSFSPFRFVRLFAGHLYLLETSFLPFYVLFFIKTVKEPNRKNVLLSVLFLTLTLFTSLTYFSFLMIFTALYIFYYLANNKKIILNKKSSRHIILTFFLFFLITSPYFYTLAKEYFTVEYKDMPRSIDESELYSADLAAFFLPLSKSVLFGKYTQELWNWQNDFFTGNWNESSVFIGFTVLSILFLSFLNKNKELNFWKFSFIIFLLLSLGPLLQIASINTEIPLPYNILFAFPPFDVSRGPSRFITMIMLMASIICGYYLANKKMKQKNIFLFLVASLIILENLYVPVGIHTDDWVSPFFSSMSKEEEDYAYLNIFPHHFGDYIYLQTISDKRILMGFISRHPLNTEDFVSKTPILRELVYEIPNRRYRGMNESEIARGFETLRSYNVKYIILHKGNILEDIFDGYLNFLNELNIARKYEDDKIIVFQVTK